MSKGIELFSPLAEDYARYRPGYPAEVLDELRRVCGLAPDWVVADIGSGTGNLARLFLTAGHQVVGVEPSREMREAGERLLAGYPNFRSIDGTAESIPLAAQSVDLITVGQALHWFDADVARTEFQRILRPGGWVAVLWNDRPSDFTAFSKEFAALRHTFENTHPTLCAPPLSAGLERLFGDVTPRYAAFPHAQHFDLPGLLGRIRSSGLLPQPGAPGCEELTERITELFHRHQQDGKVEFHYLAHLYVGQLTA
ncbi:MAG: class I SAM-dependent methyltransferase [Armatimonadota bacterium]